MRAEALSPCLISSKLAANMRNSVAFLGLLLSFPVRALRLVQVHRASQSIPTLVTPSLAFLLAVNRRRLSHQWSNSPSQSPSSRPSVSAISSSVLQLTTYTVPEDSSARNRQGSRPPARTAEPNIGRRRFGPGSGTDGPRDERCERHCKRQRFHRLHQLGQRPPGSFRSTLSSSLEAELTFLLTYRPALRMGRPPTLAQLPFAPAARTSSRSSQLARLRTDRPEYPKLPVRPKVRSPGVQAAELTRVSALTGFSTFCNSALASLVNSSLPLASASGISVAPSSASSGATSAGTKGSTSPSGTATAAGASASAKSGAGRTLAVSGLSVGLVSVAAALLL